MFIFTSDFHFCHNRDFVFKKRGFKTIEEMNEELIRRFNSKVSCDDEVYILGDCCLNDTRAGINFLRRLNGHKHLIIGNHDTDERITEYKNANIFESIDFGGRIKIGKMIYVLSHYPMCVANFAEPKAVINLYGHTHQNDSNFYEDGDWHNYHVGVDSHNCYPVSLQEIEEEIKKVKGNEK